MTWRSVLLGLLLIPVNCYWVTVVEVRWYTLDGSCLPLFVTPIFMLFVLTLFNLALRWLRAGWSLTQGELRAVYIMLVLSSTLNGHDMIQNLFGSLGHPHQFATPYNQWQPLFFRYLPGWLLQSDTNALRAFYEGGSSIYSWAAVRPWLVPLGNWAVIVLAMVLVMLCLNLLVREQWTEKEKLGFPLIQLPMEMTMDGAGTVFKDKMMWAGFGAAAFIDLLNGLHALYPLVPWFSVIKQYDVRQHFTERPWTAISRMTISMYPFAIGLAFFLPTDLSFSCWFFYVLRMVEEVFGSIFGWEKAKGFPYFNQQATGAWLALALIAAWGCRRAFGQAWVRAFAKGGARETGDGTRQRPGLRWTFVGLASGVALLVAVTVRAGMSLWAAALFFAVYFLLALAMTRVRAELGTPHEIYFVNPERFMVESFGTRLLGVRNLTVLSVYYWFNRCYRCHPMPNQLEAFKIGERSRMETGKLVAVVTLGTLAGLLFSYWANLHVCYSWGAQAKCVGFKSWVGWESFGNLESWINSPVKPEMKNLSFVGLGFALTLALKALRTRFVWLPFHFAGYGLAVSFAMDYFWFAFFLSWLIKVAVLRYGGYTGNRKAISFMLGLILGDYVCGSIWAILGPSIGKANYKIFI